MNTSISINLTNKNHIQPTFKSKIPKFAVDEIDSYFEKLVQENTNNISSQIVLNSTKREIQDLVSQSFLYKKLGELYNCSLSTINEIMVDKNIPFAKQEIKIAKIAKKYNISESSIWQFLHELCNYMTKPQQPISFIASHDNDIREYAAKGYSASYIAKSLGVSPSTVTRYAKNRHITIAYKTQIGVLRMNEEDVKNKIARECKLEKIAEEYDVHVSTIHSFVNCLGLTTRKSRILLNKSKEDIRKSLENGASTQKIAQQYNVSELFLKRWLFKEGIEFISPQSPIYGSIDNIKYMASLGYTPAKIAYAYGVNEKEIVELLQCMDSNFQILKEDLSSKENEIRHNFEQFYTLSQLSQIYKVPKDTIRNFLKSIGIKYSYAQDVISENGKIIEDLVKQNFPVPLIAKTLKFSRYNLYQYLTAKKIKPRGKGTEYHQLARYDKEVKQMFERGYKYVTIARRFGVTSQAVKSYIVAHLNA